MAARAAVGAVALLMGLNLLEVLPLRFPSVDVDVRALGLPPLAVAFAAGLTFALAASPCSTPILAALLAYAATAEAPAAGASLLFTYSLGYIAPLIVAASATVRRALFVSMAVCVETQLSRSRRCMLRISAKLRLPMPRQCPLPILL